MRKDIMLCFLSDVKTQDKKISVAEYQNIGDQKECHTTNESAVRYLLYGSNEPVDKLSRLFLVRTNKVTGNITCLVKEQDLEGKETSRYIDYKDEQERTWTHYKYFLHRISELIADTEEIEDIRVRDIVEHIDFDEDKPIEENMNALIRVASCVRAYAKSVREDDPAAEIVLHVDCTGGMRNASMILVALMRLLEYERIEIGRLTARAMEVVRSVSHPHGFNLGMNQGEVAGAGIAAHLHQHIVPRWTGDANFMPIIGKTKPVPQLLGVQRDQLAAAWDRAPATPTNDDSV